MASETLSVCVALHAATWLENQSPHQERVRLDRQRLSLRRAPALRWYRSKSTHWAPGWPPHRRGWVGRDVSEGSSSPRKVPVQRPSGGTHRPTPESTEFGSAPGPSAAPKPTPWGLQAPPAQASGSRQRLFFLRGVYPAPGLQGRVTAQGWQAWQGGQRDRGRVKTLCLPSRRSRWGLRPPGPQESSIKLSAPH